MINKLTIIVNIDNFKHNNCIIFICKINLFVSIVICIYLTSLEWETTYCFLSLMAPPHEYL